MISNKKQLSENNHLFPQFHINYWKSLGGKKYIKRTDIISDFKPENVFSKKRYYSKGEPNDELENRIGDFESFVGGLIKKINDSKGSISLTGNEVEILKLYVYFCGCRQEFTTEVIKEDPWGIYQSNKYFLGMPRIDSQEGVIQITNLILDEFNILKKKKKDPTKLDYKLASKWSPTMGLHLAILRANGPQFVISDRFCIIENTMDSDFLYSYVPVTPTTALLLVKSDYYLDSETFRKSKRRLSLKNGGNGNDPWLSAVFGCCGLYENLLFCSYAWTKLKPSLKNEFVMQKEIKSPIVAINICPDDVVDSLNSILIEDGDEVLFCDEHALKRALQKNTPWRHIS